MYKFTDTTERPDENELPAEALMLNGEYIENLIPSQFGTYRTLYVKGREELSPEINYFTTGIRDGATILSKRFPERVLTVGYQLKAPSAADFREAYNLLNSILNVKDAELIFNDESDKFFTGTPSGLEEVSPGLNNVTGEFTILCADPFKYSVSEYEAETDGIFTIEYGGTYKAFPTLMARFHSESECGEDGREPTELTGDGDCGYVAWFNEEAKIIQIGSPNDSGKWSDTLAAQDFRKVTEWTDALNVLWSDGILFDMGTSSGTTGFSQGPDGNLLTAADYGSGAAWHGCSVRRTFASSDSFTAKWTMGLYLDDAYDACGCLQTLLVDSDDNIVAGVDIRKGPDNVSSMAAVSYVINNAVAKTKSIDISAVTAGSSITKTGDTVTVNLGGTLLSFTDSTIGNVTSLVFGFGAYGTYATVPVMGIYDVTFVKNNEDDWQDIPNKFTANDTVTAVCGSGDILVNDAPSPEYGAIGNNWEDFCLKPGYNQIGFSCSSWTVKPPTTTIRYRECFL